MVGRYVVARYVVALYVEVRCVVALHVEALYSMWRHGSGATLHHWVHSAPLGARVDTGGPLGRLGLDDPLHARLVGMVG